MALLDLKNVSLKENNANIIDNISLSIQPGSFTALLGKPGSGKSTLLKLMAGLILPSSGNIFFEGSSIHKMNHQQTLQFRKRCAFMFQDSALWANQDIYHNLELPLQIHFPNMTNEEKDEKINQIVKMIHYEKPLTQRPAALSIGEQKKISFARALICDPEVLFLDEPTESIDQSLVEEFMELLREFNTNKKTIIVVSHDNYFISSFFCDKIYLDNGKISRKEILGDLLVQ